MFYEAVGFFAIILIFIFVFSGVVYYTVMFPNVNVRNITNYVFTVFYMSIVLTIIVLTCYIIEKAYEAKKHIW